MTIEKRIYLEVSKYESFCAEVIGGVRWVRTRDVKALLWIPPEADQLVYYNVKLKDGTPMNWGTNHTYYLLAKKGDVVTIDQVKANPEKYGKKVLESAIEQKAEVVIKHRLGHWTSVAPKKNVKVIDRDTREQLWPILKTKKPEHAPPGMQGP